MGMKEQDKIENRIFLFLPVVPAIFAGIFADRFIFRWEEYSYYCTAFLASLTVLVVPAVFLVRDAVKGWSLWLAMKK
ncbi:MAG TPA: hypothetical protein VK254_04480 [Candidatus Bathyarchaeia archaeon]|nr:hypothetical protein [Candidatus Bathyarchaeia archaeon]